MNIRLHYDVPGDDFTRAGEASSAVKRKLKQLGFQPDVIRRVAIAMYEGEINMVIHAGGGEADVEILPGRVTAVLTDHGPGIPDVEQAMQEGWSTAPDNVRNGYTDRSGKGDGHDHDRPGEIGRYRITAGGVRRKERGAARGPVFPFRYLG